VRPVSSLPLQVLLLAPVLAHGQAMASFPGDRPGAVAYSGPVCTAPPKNTLAVYGDSIGAGACSPTPLAVKVAQLLGEGWVASGNAGDGQPPALSGYTAAQIRARYEATCAAACNGEECGYLVVQGVVNSLKGGVSPEEALEDMVAIVDDAILRGIPVVWVGPLPYAGCTEPTCSAASVANAHAKATAYRSLMATACAERPEVKCIDAYEAFEDPEQQGHLRDDYACENGDGIHLRQAGTDALAAQIAAQIALLGAVCL
jgi:lysophospholipase L1-like esterase